MKDNKYMKMKTTAIVLILLVVLLAPLLSCGSKNEGNISSDIAMLQKEIPFSIVLPEYLPNDIRQYHPKVEGPIELSDGSVWIRITYAVRGGSMNTIILEEIGCSDANFRQNPDEEYIEIGGVKVSEMESESSIYPSTPTMTIRQIIYSWSRGGVCFVVTVYGYGREEAIKVIASMIQ